MQFKSAALLLPLLLAPALMGCGEGVNLPEKSLPSQAFTLPVTLDSSNILVQRGHLFKEKMLFDKAINSRVNSIKVLGKATLNTPASSALVIDVLLVEELEDLPTLCVSYTGYRLCDGGGTSIGTVTIAAGQTEGKVELNGALLTEVAHACGGYVGVHLAEGKLERGSKLELTDMVAKSKGKLF